MGGFISGLVKGFRTGDWNESFYKRGKNRSRQWHLLWLQWHLAVNPIGILGFSVIMAVTSALITDERLKQLNSFINGI
ncbi:colicin-like pore-forming protein [Klebsiella pneumoniae]